MKKIRKEIYVGIIILLVLRTFFINEELFFILSIMYMIYICFIHNKNVYIPKIPGIFMYLSFILYSLVTGLLLYTTRNIIRDLFYILPSLIWIFIGYNLCFIPNNEKSVLKTLYIYGGITSTFCAINYLLHPAMDFNTIRIIFGTNIFDIGFIVAILTYEKYICKKNIFSKKIDLYLIIIMFLQVVLSFGRMAIIQPIISLVVMCIMAIFSKKSNPNTVKHVLKLFIVALIMITIVISLMIYFIPSNVLEFFINKISRTFVEIDSEQNIYSISTAMINWRAYEMQVAKEQWNESNILVKMFGAGLGKGVHIQYIPISWNNIVSNNEIPILHNGFYTLLPKGGIYAVMSLIIIFLGCIRIGITNMRNDNNKVVNMGIILVGLNIAAVANTYVLRGPVQQGTFFVWAILVGYLCCQIRMNKNK